MFPQEEPGTLKPRAGGNGQVELPSTPKVTSECLPSFLRSKASGVHAAALFCLGVYRPLESKPVHVCADHCWPPCGGFSSVSAHWAICQTLRANSAKPLASFAFD